MKRTLWLIPVLFALVLPSTAEAVVRRFTCTGYTVTFDDGTQRCSSRCTQCRAYDANDELIYEGEPYCIDQGCIQVR
jgi:hypothetical protein